MVFGLLRFEQHQVEYNYFGCIEKVVVNSGMLHQVERLESLSGVVATRHRTNTGGGMMVILELCGKESGTT